MNYTDYIADVPDFPSKGILFRDVTPLLQNGEAFASAVAEIAEYCKSKGAELVVAPDARGFMVGCPVATMLKIGFVPVRKPGKLPRETVSCKYDLEYGSNELFIHKDAIKPGQKVVIIDDLLATGGTVDASIKMVKDLGGEVVGCGFLIELTALGGREVLKDQDIFALMKY